MKGRNRPLDDDCVLRTTEHPKSWLASRGIESTKAIPQDPYDELLEALPREQPPVTERAHGEEG